MVPHDGRPARQPGITPPVASHSPWFDLGISKGSSVATRTNAKYGFEDTNRVWCSEGTSAVTDLFR